MNLTNAIESCSSSAAPERVRFAGPLDGSAQAAWRFEA
jgi:hypothetical protein